MIHLLESRIFNRESLRMIVDRLKEKKGEGKEEQQERAQQLADRLYELEAAIKNITDAVIRGLYSPALGEKLSELEQEKASLEAEQVKVKYVEEKKIPQVDPELILGEYIQVKKAESSPKYKQMIQDFIEKISVGRYRVEIVLKTGLDIFPSLDTCVQVKRQDIYKNKGELS